MLDRRLFAVTNVPTIERAPETVSKLPSHFWRDPNVASTSCRSIATRLRLDLHSPANCVDVAPPIAWRSFCTTGATQGW
jgi:hypothetical protein